MTLRQELKQLTAIASKKEKQTQKEATKNRIRNDDDWKIISAYLSETLKHLAENSKGKKWLQIDYGARLMFPRNPTGERIKLTDNSELFITSEDIIRFCKENKLKLRFLYKRYSDEFEVVKNFRNNFNLRSYLISF